MQIRSVDDPCLQSERWVEVATVEELEGAGRAARRHNIPQVQLTLPVTQPPSNETLIQSGLTKGLILLQADIKDLNIGPQLSSATSSQLTNSPELQPVPSFHQCQAVLAEQADHHAQLAPQFYRTFAQIDQQRYQATVSSDFTEPTSLYVYQQSAQNQVIGLVMGAQADQQTLLVWELVVLASEQKQGIARQLFSQLAQLADQRGVTQVQTEVWWNNPALHFYTKLGFEPISQTYVRYLG